MQIMGEMPWTPDGTIGVSDRLIMLEFYSGIEAADGTPNYLGGMVHGGVSLRGQFEGDVVLRGRFHGAVALGGKFRAN